MSTFWQDLRHGVRLAATRPGFTAVAVVTLALGIGPNTAVFSVVNSLVLSPPPYPDPDRIVSTPQIARGRADRARLSLPSTDDFQDWRRETRTLAYVALYAPDSLTLTGFGDPVRLNGARVSPALFPLLGVGPMVGRTFIDSEEQPAAAPVVLLSHTLWDQKLGRDPAIVGKPLVLDGVGRQVVGIMPARFEFPAREIEYWVPYPLAPPERGPNERRVAIVPFLARLKPGVSIEQAAAEGNTIIIRNRDSAPGGPGPDSTDPGGSAGRSAGPDGEKQRATTGGRVGGSGQGSGGHGGPPGGAERVVRQDSGGSRGGPGASRPPSGLPLQLVTLQERRSGPLRSALFVLSAAVGLVLFIACANVANLLLSRAASRSREISIRGALGASRGRLVRQMLTESAVFSLLGGILGLLFAVWVVRLLPQLGTAGVARLNEVHLDLRVLLFAALVSTITTLLFGLAPALATARRGLAESLKRRSAAGSAGLHFLGRNRARSALTITQVALALMLLVGAGLLTRSLFTLLGQHLGYRPEGALTVQIQLPRARYPLPQARTAFLDQMLAGMRTMPGVQAAGATNLMPMSQAQISVRFELPGLPVDANPNEPISASVRLVSPGFFKALGTQLLGGREFDDTDRAGGERVVIINSALAARYMAGLDPVGRQIELDGPRRIVGMVESIKPQGLDSEPAPEMYFPLTQFDELLMAEGPLAAATLVVRTSGDPLGLVGAVRAQMGRLDPQLPLFNITTLGQRVADSVAQPRFYAVVLLSFAGLALVLAAVGIYGVLSSQVAQSAREIGIRMALGAGPAHIRRSMLGHAAVLAVVGVGLGLAGAWGLSRFIASLLFGVTPFDLVTYVGAAVVLGAATLAGAYLPTRRATMVDPVVVLRCE
jgi:predicted permease